MASYLFYLFLVYHLAVLAIDHRGYLLIECEPPVNRTGSKGQRKIEAERGDWGRVGETERERSCETGRRGESERERACAC